MDVTTVAQDFNDDLVDKYAIDYEHATAVCD
jgi:hypothetical protein